LDVSEGFSEAERERFHNLLELAARSPFAGERDNALSAAERLAARHGMSLDEAAAEPEDPMPMPPPEPARPAWVHRDLARAVHLMDDYIAADKARREEAYAEARRRGLDATLEAPPQKRPKPLRFGGRMPPRTHARILLEETALTLREIVELTGLDMYEVAGMKLKLRREHGGRTDWQRAAAAPS
jgi:hypothetical protein